MAAIITFIGAFMFFAFFAAANDFLNGLTAGQLRGSGIFVGVMLLIWLLAWWDDRPSKGCR